MTMKNENTEKIEAATYRKIIQFLRESKDVQNIDLMNLAGFAETVFLNGIWLPLKKRALILIMKRREKLCTECHTPSGKKNIRSKNVRVCLGFVCYDAPRELANFHCFNYRPLSSIYNRNLVIQPVGCKKKFPRA